MKTINKIRNTNQFCITGTDVSLLVAIHHRFNEHGWHIIGVANDKDNSCAATVRAYSAQFDDNGMTSVYDFVILCYGNSVKIIERKLITGPRIAITLGFECDDEQKQES